MGQVNRGKILFLAIFLTASHLAFPNSVSAQIFDDDYQDLSKGIDIAAQLALRSDRIFRGQNLYNGTSIQPQVRGAMELGDGQLHGGLFSHIGAEGSDPRRTDSPPFDGFDEDGNSQRVVATQTGFNELDFDLGYAFNISPARIDLGHRMYFYDESSQRLQDTREVYADISFDTAFYPYVELAYDYDDFEGLFYNLGARYPIPLGLNDERSILVPFIELGFSAGLDDGDNAIYNDSGLMYVDIGTKSQLYVTKTVSVEPEIWYNYGIDDATSKDLTFGVNLVSEFK